MDAPGVKIERMLSVFGMTTPRTGTAKWFPENVRVPVENVLLGNVGAASRSGQGRLAGRIHHCTRTIGVGRGDRGDGQAARQPGGVRRGLPTTRSGSKADARARIDIEMTRLLCPGLGGGT